MKSKIFVLTLILVAGYYLFVGLSVAKEAQRVVDISKNRLEQIEQELEK